MSEGRGSAPNTTARCWFYHVADVFNPNDLRFIAAHLQATLAESPRMGAKPFSPGGKPGQYKTLSASKFPCSCEYRFQGYNMLRQKYCVPWPATAGPT